MRDVILPIILLLLLIGIFWCIQGMTQQISEASAQPTSAWVNDGNGVTHIDVPGARCYRIGGSNEGCIQH